MQSPNLPGPDPEPAIEFFVDCLDFNPIHLARIKSGAPICHVIQRRYPDGTPKTREELVAESHKWMKAWSSWNQYFTSGQVRSDIEENPPKKGKPTERDIHAVRFLAVDLDPRRVPSDWTGTGPEWVEAERGRILPTLTTDLPPGVPGPPSRILDSGGGYWGIWLLETPFTIGDPEKDIAWAKAHRAYLIELYRKHFGDDAGIVDGVANIDRLCRLPGSLNRPDKKKREEKGRSDAPARWLTEHGSDWRYPIEAFAPPQRCESKAAANNRAFEIVADSVKPIQDLDAELPSTVPPVVKRVIACGEDPENGEPHRVGWSRSEWQWWATCELVRRGVSDDAIYSILTDPEWKVSDSIFVDSKGVERSASGVEQYATRQIERAQEFAIAPELVELNDEYAFVEEVGGRARIMSFYRDPILDQDEVVFTLPSGFKMAKGNQQVQVDTTDSGKPVMAPLGEWWIKHRLRRSYDRVVFAPGRDLPPSIYNLWQGFGVDPEPGACGLFLEHLRANVCRGVAEHYEYLPKWMANAVQNPGRQGHVAIVLRGPKGVGKSFFATQFGKLWGRHFKHITNPDHLVGKFNAMLMDGALVFADEAFYAGNARHAQALKTLITEDRITVELKGLDMKNWPNCTKLIMASNEEWIVRATKDERRFFVLEVGSERIQNRPYFKRIVEELEDGGYEALLHHLLAMDLSGFDVTAVPKTEALREQVSLTLTAEPRAEWLLTLLMDGELPNNVPGEPRAAYSTETERGAQNGLYDHARRVVPDLRHRSDTFLSRGPAILGARNVKPNGAGRFWRFPPLADARAAYEERYGAQSWPGDPEADWTDVGPPYDYEAHETFGDG